MAKPLPEWQLRFLEQHKLPGTYLQSAQKWFDPLAMIVAEHQSSARRPWLLAVNGSQGSGKTTLCAYLCAAFAARGLSCIALSIDDFYLTRAERHALAESVHPLLATRGVPGTHDMDLMTATLDALLAGEAISVPRFDKAVDDRLPSSGWDVVAAPVDLIVVVGW